MAISNITAGYGTTRPEDAGLDKSSAQKSQNAAAASAAAKASDTFASSGKATVARQLIDRLSEGQDVRADLVDKFSALLASGELDTPEAAARAADALVEGSRGSPDFPA